MDDSIEMLEERNSKLRSAAVERPYELTRANLNKRIEIKNALVVVLCLTLQFARPVNREKLLKQIYNGLKPNGVLLQCPFKKTITYCGKSFGNAHT